MARRAQSAIMRPMKRADAAFRDRFPLKGFTHRSVPTRYVDLLSDEDLAELNSILHWNCFTVDGRGRRFGNAAHEGKRDTPQEIPDRRIVLMDERFGLADKHVLEIGCFEGIHTVALCERARRVTAVDSRIENVVKTIVRCAMFGCAPEVFKCNVEERPLDVEPLRCDVLHHVGVLYHLRDPVQHLLDVGRIARTGVMLDTHYSLPEEANRSYEAGGRTYRFKTFRESGHQDVFSGMYEQSKWLTLDGIVEGLREAGFGDVEVVETIEARYGPRALLLARRSA